jgi:hypothetical protein
MAAIAATVGLCAGVAAYAVASQLLGGVSPVISLAVAAGFTYLVLSTPRRILLASALAQAREAPVLAASATLHLQTTRSRSKTLLMIQAQDEELNDYLRAVRRRIILGIDAHAAVRGKDDDGGDAHPASESVQRILQSISEFSGGKITTGSVELEGIQSSSALGEETKVPVFIAVSFFTPLLLILFSALSKNTGLLALISILLLEVIILDLTYSISSAERELLGS